MSHLVHAAGRECVTDVWINGVRIVEARRLTTVDEDEVLAKARTWQHKLQSNILR